MSWLLLLVTVELTPVNWYNSTVLNLRSLT